MSKCNVTECFAEAEFAVKIGSAVGRYCGHDTLELLRSDSPKIIWDCDAEDSEILATEF